TRPRPPPARSWEPEIEGSSENLLFHFTPYARDQCIAVGPPSPAGLPFEGRYQFVIEPSGRKYVCARLVTGCVTSEIIFNCFISNSTPSPGRSFGQSLPFLKSTHTGI